jgi:hypothetical protein
MSEFGSPDPGAASTASVNGAKVDFAASDDRNFDKQLTYFAAFALLALVVCVVLVFLYLTGVTGFGTTFQSAVNVITTRIRSSFPGGIQLLQQAVGTVKATSSAALTQTTTAISDGAATVINVALALGAGVVETVITALSGTLDLLADLASDVIQFFQNVFVPIDNVINILSITVIDSLGLVVAQYEPIVVLITQLILAIEEIGQKF